MEKKNKDHKLTPSPSTSEPVTNGLLLNPKIDDEQGKEDEKSQNPVGVELSGKKPRNGSPSNDNVPFQNDQNTPNNQWSCTLPPVNEQQQPQMVAATSFPTHAPSPVVASRWQPQMPSNPGFNQGQQFPLPPHFGSSNPLAFWLPQRPGYQVHGAQGPGSCQSPFTPMGSLDNSWQVPAGNGLVTTSRSVGQIPGVCYQFGYPYPAYSAGPWDPSSWWGQMQQAPPPCVHPLPGAYNNSPFSSPQPTTNCSAASGQSSQKGVIRPSVKLSQKHRVMWEAQSAENVQLWAVIAGLQSDLADCKSRLVKLETEAKTMKLSGEQLAAHGTGSSFSGQTSKRGRPKKLVVSVDALPSPDEPHPRPRGKKPAIVKAPPEIREINFRRENLNKVEHTAKASPFITSQQANSEKFTSIFTTSSNPVQFSSVDPSCRNRILPHIRQTRRSEDGIKSSSEMKTSDSKSQGNCKKNITINEASAAYKGTTNDRNLGWSSNMPFIQMMRAISEGFDSHGSEDLDETSGESEGEEDEEVDIVAETCAEDISQAKKEISYIANTSRIGKPPGFSNC